MVHQHSRGTVIVADDNSIILELISFILSDEGYTALPACNGFDAIEASMSLPERPDILVTDVDMPEMDGIELARSLRERFPGLPVLFVSGKLPSDALDLYLLEPVTSYLKKPFLFDELLQCVDDLCVQAEINESCRQPETVR